MVDVSVALGGGGVKGVAHIGVLDGLERCGVRIRALTGTSAGALVGALYASGCTPGDIADLFKSLDQHHMFGRMPADGPSLLGMTGVARQLTSVLGSQTFADLRIPFACTAVDASTGREIILRQGRVIDAVLASSAVPGVFPAVQSGDISLIDGGVVDPVPVALARLLAPNLPAVAVVLSPAPEAWAHLPGIQLPAPPVAIPSPIIEGLARLRIAQAMRIFLQSVDITSRALTELRLQIDQSEVIIRPDVDRFSLLQEVDPDQLIDLGLHAARNALPEIRRVTSWAYRLTRRFQRSPAPELLFSSEH